MSQVELDSVTKANEAFYRAFESLDIQRMEGVWAKTNYVQCFHPGWRLLRGWQSVIDSWRQIFENTPEIHFTLSDIRVEIRDSVAWVTLNENITSRAGGDLISGLVLATNVYEKQHEGWLLIHHHGSSVAQPPTQPDSTTLH